jgi:hypothetical protein
MAGYAKAKRDWLFLEDLEDRYAQGDRESSDQINAADEVFNLMADPTKKRATDMYISAIDSWFYAYDGSSFGGKVPSEFAGRIEDIRSHYGF